MISDKNEALKKIRASRFVKNNGAVIRAVNLLRIKFVNLSDVKYALEDIEEADYLDSINYLSESEYISLRNIKTKQPAQISDVDYDKLEAKLTAKGIRLLAGNIFDDMVEV